MARRRRHRTARQLARTLVPALPAFLRLLGGLLRDRRVALMDKAFLAAVIAYVIMPLDLIPDFLGVLGLSDDLFLLALALRRLVVNAGETVLESHWTGSPEALEQLTGGLADLGSLLPRPVRGLLRGLAGRR